jgi:hypothetical protein
MAIELKHKFVSTKPDGGDATLVKPSNWNDGHDLLVASGTVLGRTTAGVGQAEELDITTFIRTNSSIGPFRNKLINALGTINQRGYVSGAATSGANQYTVDRWRVVTSGQNLSWTESEGVRTFTAPAGGVEQVIWGGSLITGTHVLNWTGTATATVNGTPRAKGETFTLTGGANATVRFTGGTFSIPQLEPGSVATPIEARSGEIEFSMCQAYFQKSYAAATAPGTATDAGSHWFRTVTTEDIRPVPLRPNMITNPTITIYNPSTGATGSAWNGSRSTSDTATPQGGATSGFSVSTTGHGAAGDSVRFHWTASGEL